jgi:hypothetical protein
MTRSDAWSQPLRDLGGRVKQALTHRALTGRLIFEWSTRLRHAVYSLRYDALSDPYAPIAVEPSTIETFNVRLDDELGLGQIVSGEWDEVGEIPLEEIYIYAGLYQRFEEGRPWTDTAYVEFARKQLDENESWGGYDDIDQFIDVRCAYVDELYERIETNGYQPNDDRSHDVPEQSVKTTRASHIHELEPLVVIGRDGTIHLRDGFHRVTIAKLLDVPEIPVLVLGRHTLWQSRRERYVHSHRDGTAIEQSNAPDTHPDLLGLSRGGE